MQTHQRRRAEQRVLWVLIGLAVVCLGWKLYAVVRADPRVFPDSADFGIEVPFISKAFGTVSLVGTGPHHILVRLPTVPLFFRALGRDGRIIVVVQAVLGTASWAVLAWVLARRHSSSLVGLGVGSAVLVFSLTAIIAMWDAHLLSESLSISFLVLLIAESISTFDQPSRARIAATVGVASIWVFIKDTNAFMLGLAALTVGILVLVRRLPRALFIVSAGWAVLAIAVVALQSNSPRWEGLYDILGKRILTDRAATQEFARAGMPVTPQVLAMADRFSDEGFKTRPELAELRRWTREHGRQTYLRYLLYHPDRTLLDPFRRPSPCPSRRPTCLPITGDLDHYWAPHWQSLFPAEFEKIVGQRFSVKQYLGAVAFCLVVGVIGLWRGRSRNYGWSIYLSIASFVFVVLAWNASSREIFRHTLDMWIYVTLAVIISLGAIADEVIRIHKSRLPESA
jgi:hypothetical protein